MLQLSQGHQAAEALRADIVRVWQAQFGASPVLAPILSVLSLVVAMVLLIMYERANCLFVALAVGRRREVAVRLSLEAPVGSGSTEQLLTESSNT